MKLIIILVMIAFHLFAHNLYNKGNILPFIKNQTDVNNATFIIKDGVPYLNIKNVGVVFHPAWTGLYALQYADIESFYPQKVKHNNKLFFHLVDVLTKKLTFLKNDSAVWLYNFDNTYNNVHIKAPWFSSFAQAIGIEVYLAAYKKTNDVKYLDLAKKVAKPLFTTISQNGLLFEDKGDIWFEEIPLKKNPTHILNAHLRTLIALHKLYKLTQDKLYKKYFDRGLNTLKKWLPKYDTGYWLRYDLNPKYKQLFRITNPYGFKTIPLAIDKISILNSHQKLILAEDIGDNDDFNNSKAIYLSGLNWKVESMEENTTIRSIDPSLPAPFEEEFESTKLKPPYTYININFPKIDDAYYYVKIDYKDNIKGNLILQQRAISPKIKWHDVSNGIFLLKGDHKQRSLIVKINKTDLGFPVGLSYAWKHYLYLEKLAKITNDNSIKQWAKVAKSYINTVEYKTNKVVRLDRLKMPKQTPVVPIFSLTKGGVVAQHFAIKKTTRINGVYDFKSPISQQSLSPYIISLQADGRLYNLYKKMFKTENFLYKNMPQYKKYDWITINEKDKITKQNAINWLKNNAHRYKDAFTWSFDFNNSYNDVVQTAPWNSAFGQAYVIKAFLENNIIYYAIKGANAYKYDISQGGVSSFDKAGNVWFEEVPNKTHIINAHLISENVLLDNLNTFNSKDINKATKNGLKSLEKYISKFDTGYWSKYDQNPKKELLFQINWINGKKSILIDDICLISTISKRKTCFDVGSNYDNIGTEKISGLDWLSSFVEDNKTVRAFKKSPLKSVYFKMNLPDRKFNDYWDITPYYLRVRYKDVAQGQFIFGLQSINNGKTLLFQPLRYSNLITTGDHKWKNFIIPIYSNDLGWYMGVDYHKYHLKQLKLLNKKVHSIELNQVIQRWQYYLEQYQTNKNPIVLIPQEFYTQIKNFKISTNLKFYKGYELSNSLDDNLNDYTASLENIPFPHIIKIEFKKADFVHRIKLVWESNKNNPQDFEVVGYNGKIVVYKKKYKNRSKITNIKINKNITNIKITIKTYNGQRRLLMRAVKIFGKDVK